MTLRLFVSPQGRLSIDDSGENSASSLEDFGPTVTAAAESRIRGAFEQGTAAGLLHLATVDLGTALPPSLAFARGVAQAYLNRLCHTPAVEGSGTLPAIDPEAAELDAMVQQAPPMRGLEYVTADVLAYWWKELDQHVREETARFPGGAVAYLREKNPLWRAVGRVTFHLAENKRDEQHPFAFMATYAHRMSAQGDVQHVPLARALQEYAGAKNRGALLTLLVPIERAAEQSHWIRELADSGGIYQALAWTPKQAHRFLQDLPAMEASGLVVRVPNWWKANRPKRATVSVKIGEAAKSKLGMDALLDFSVGVTLDGETIDEAELRELLASTNGLVRLHGQWIEVDRDKLSAALDHWKKVEREARGGGISFFEGMRLLAGADVEAKDDPQQMAAIREWSGLAAGDWLDRTLADLRDPERLNAAPPTGLQAELRPYQRAGVSWLRFMTKLGLGACLADDMGLGKTIQMIALLLHEHESHKPGEGAGKPSLLVVPASLIANWKSELQRFAPSLSIKVNHPSEPQANPSETQKKADLIITTYGMLMRQEELRKQPWNLIVLDEAQAIKNSGTRQAKAVKELQAVSRVALTGTPVENRLSDLWSLFDFLNPGLLGSAKAFSRFCKSMSGEQGQSFGPLRTLVKPYILRRLKTDKSIISDLPDKTEIKAYCGLSKRQAILYEQSVRELADQIAKAEGIQRRGIVLAYLMRLKQLCNHPSQWLGDKAYAPEDSGKFARLAELCEELAARQEKVLVFTQFREVVDPLAAFLETIFGRPGLTLHGGTSVAKRRERVDAFQQDGGAPFFVLSIKAGGTGLNLTAASQVIHFDRWWNPAVENQATDRAFRIGQKRNVLVHKFVCRGTVEEKIDGLIAEKSSLSHDLLEGGAERMLTEMSNRELLDFVSLDVSKAAAD